MPLKVTCSGCGKVFSLDRPYPVPGSEIQCECGRVLVLSYPTGLIKQLKKTGPVFEEPSAKSQFPIPFSSESKK